MAEGRKGVVVVGLVKALVAKKVRIVSHQVRNLLEDQDEPDGCHHSFNYGVGHVVAYHAQLEQAHCDLYDAGKDDRHQKDFERAQVADRRQHHGGEARGRSRNAQRRPTEGANDYAAHHAGHDSAQ